MLLITYLHQPAGRLLLTATLWSLPSLQYLQHLLIFNLTSIFHCGGNIAFMCPILWKAVENWQKH